MSDVPPVRASQLCANLRGKHSSNTGAGRIACWICTHLAPKAFTGRRWARKPGNRGCPLVNKAYDDEERQFRRQTVNE
ncbi:MAG: hypothetical protein ACYC6L_12640 [Anaerolineae bacterium]